MPYSENPIHSMILGSGYKSGRMALSSDLEGFCSYGSSNTLFLGDGYWKPFAGVDSKGPGTGSRIMRPVGQTWGGIRDVGVTLGSGTISEEINRSLWGIG